MKRALTSLILIALALPLRAELVWEKKLVELDLSARPAETVATYPFRNTGKEPVRIAIVLSSCDCATPKLEKDVVAPAESGEIRVTFKPDGTTGRLERTVAVITADAPESPTILTLRVVVPPAPRANAK